MWGHRGCISTPEAPSYSILYRKPLRVTYGQLESLKSSVGQRQSSGPRNMRGGITLLHGDSHFCLFFYLLVDNICGLERDFAGRLGVELSGTVAWCRQGCGLSGGLAPCTPSHWNNLASHGFGNKVRVCLLDSYQLAACCGCTQREAVCLNYHDCKIAHHIVLSFLVTVNI